MPAPSQPLLDRIEGIAAPYGLMTMGGAHIEAEQAIVLLGTAATFWDKFIETREFSDAKVDPVDRWSKRVMPEIMQAAGAQDVIFPFGGPPYAPFLSWAKQTGEAFDSPVGMLVHYRSGLMISYRGALVFDRCLPLPDMCLSNPCDDCTDRPCLTACPVDALSELHPYDVPACKSYLATDKGDSCVTLGCAVRRACPVSQSFGRATAQSAHHMRAFKGELG
ncbi:MAG: ferredoxin [Sulfitobacter sp.]